MYRRLSRGVRGRRWSSSAKPTPSHNASSTAQNISLRSSAPGTVRVTKGYGADKHEAELDSTLARIIGSDWGDRSRQPVSLPMRIYWIVFAVVLGNGLFTYLAGKDESFLVEKLKKKADEKLGVKKEENEFAILSDAQQNDVSATTATVPAQSSKKEVVVAVGPSMLNTSVVSSSSGMPFIAPGVHSHMNVHQPKSKMELEQQLAQLQVQQEKLQRQICSGEGTAKEELEHQVRMIDIQKEQIKLMSERLLKQRSGGDQSMNETYVGTTTK